MQKTNSLVFIQKSVLSEEEAFLLQYAIKKQTKIEGQDLSYLKINKILKQILFRNWGVWSYLNLPSHHGRLRY